MKAHLLAGVLVKVLGLSMAVYAIASIAMSICTGVYAALAIQKVTDISSFGHSLGLMWQSVMTTAAYGVVHFGLGCFLIAKTEYIVEKILKIDVEA